MQNTRDRDALPRQGSGVARAEVLESTISTVVVVVVASSVQSLRRAHQNREARASWLLILIGCM